MNSHWVLRWLGLLAWYLPGIAYASSGTVALGTATAAPAILADGKAVALLSSPGESM